MENRVIFTDRCSDLSSDELKRHNLWPEAVNLHLTYNGADISPKTDDEFYDHLIDGSYAPGGLKSSSPSYADAKKVLDDIIANTPESTEIVYAGTSPFISAGTANLMRMVLDDYSAEYPNRKFTFVDTLCTSNGQGLDLQYLAAYQGDDIVSYAHDIGKHIVHLFTQRDFNYSAKSGRYAFSKRIVMLVASAVHVSPWMYFPSDDKLQTDSTIRRGDKILHEWVDYYLTNRAAPNEPIRIGYGGRTELGRAEKFIALLEAAGVQPEQIQLTHVGRAIGAHTGHTVLSFFFRQKNER